MELIGFMDSPFVRRVAISMEFLGVEFMHRELSIFRDFEEFRQINPLVKVPTLVLGNGTVLVESTLIIDYLEKQVAHRSLMPDDPVAFLEATRLVGIALIASEKVVSIIYETGQRPAELVHQPWIDRIRKQLHGALRLLEGAAADCDPSGDHWLAGNSPGQADITTAVLWRFTQHIQQSKIKPSDFPALAALSAQAETLQEFQACPLSE